VRSAAYGQPERPRTAAIAALDKLGKKNPALLPPTLLALAQNDPYFRARSSTVAALGKLGQRSTLEPLAKIQSSDSEVGVTNAADNAIAGNRESIS
jgi:HEAT repeat protein